MQVLKRILGFLGFIWLASIFVAVFLLFYPLFLITLSHSGLYPVANVLRRIWAFLIVFLTGILPDITRIHPIGPGPVIIVANHSSYLDIVMLGLIAPLRMSFMAKKELAQIPLFGIFFRTIDIAVERSSIIASHKAFLIAEEKLKRGFSVIVFPEGTISAKAPQMKPFKSGAFKLAIETGTPIVPVVFMNNFKRLPDGFFQFYPGRSRVVVHRAIDTAGLKIAEAGNLSDKIFTIIENQLKSAG